MIIVLSDDKSNNPFGGQELTDLSFLTGKPPKQTPAPKAPIPVQTPISPVSPPPLPHEAPVETTVPAQQQEPAAETPGVPVQNTEDASKLSEEDPYYEYQDVLKGGLYNLISAYKNVVHHVPEKMKSLYNLDWIFGGIKRANLLPGKTVENYIKELVPEASGVDVDNILKTALSYFAMPLPRGHVSKETRNITNNFVAAIAHAAQAPLNMDQRQEKMLELANKIRYIFPDSSREAELEKMKLINEAIEMALPSDVPGKKVSISRMIDRIEKKRVHDSGEEIDIKEYDILPAIMNALYKYKGENGKEFEKILNDEFIRLEKSPYEEMREREKKMKEKGLRLFTTKAPQELSPYVSFSPSVGESPFGVKNEDGTLNPDAILRWYKKDKWGGEERINQAIEQWNDSYNKVMSVVNSDPYLKQQFMARNIPVEPMEIIPYGFDNNFDHPSHVKQNLKAAHSMARLFKLLSKQIADNEEDESISPMEKQQNELIKTIKNVLSKNGIDINFRQFLVPESPYYLKGEMIDPSKYGFNRQGVYDAISLSKGRGRTTLSQEDEAESKIPKKDVYVPGKEKTNVFVSPETKTYEGEEGEEEVEGLPGEEATYRPELDLGNKSITTTPIKKGRGVPNIAEMFQGLRGLVSNPEKAEEIKDKRHLSGVMARDYEELYKDLTPEERNKLISRTVFISPVTKHGPRSGTGMSVPIQGKELIDYGGGESTRPYTVWNEVMNKAVDAAFKGNPNYDPEVNPDAPGQIYYEIGKMIANGTSINFRGEDKAHNLSNINEWMKANQDKLSKPLFKPPQTDVHGNIVLHETELPKNQIKATMFDATSMVIKMLAHTLMNDNLFSTFVKSIAGDKEIHRNNPQLYEAIVESLPKEKSAVRSQLTSMFKKAGVFLTDSLWRT